MVKLEFEVDPSISKIPFENYHLAEYMKERFLTIDVFDAKSMFFYGFCKIPLFELLRQGNPVKVIAKECEVFNPHNNQYNGQLHVVLSNSGSVPREN